MTFRAVSKKRSNHYWAMNGLKVTVLRNPGTLIGGLLLICDVNTVEIALKVVILILR